MKWLITGGCGFIGTSLISRILSTTPDADIRILDNLSVGTREDLAEVCGFEEVESHELDNCRGVQLVLGDIKDISLCQEASRDMDCIVHLAANTGVGPSVENPRIDMEINIIGTFNMLEAARCNNVSQFVFASSGAPAGVVEPPIHEEMAPHPVSPYGASKLAGEGYCSAYFQSFSVNTTVLRFGNVYGPRSKHKSSVVAKFIRRAMAGLQLEIYGDGSQTRDFIYIDDLIEAILLSVSSSSAAGEVFQIATNNETTLNQLTNVLSDVLVRAGFARPEVFNKATRLGDVKRNYSDTSKANRLLGWKACTKLETGLLRTVDWFAQGAEST